MTTNTTFTQPAIAAAALPCLRADVGQMSGQKSAPSLAAHSTYVATGFGADLRIVPAVQGVLPRGVPV